MKIASWLLVICLAGCGAETAPTAQPGPVVLMGDSITALWAESIPPDYPAAVPTLYAHIPGAIDVGIGGQTTDQMLARFDTDVIANRPYVVVLLGGTNDIRLDQNATIDNIAAMAQKAASAGAHVLVGTIPPSALWNVSAFLTPENTPGAIQQWNSKLRTMANAYGYEVVDYYEVLLGADGNANEALFLPDGIHPNSDGYAAMWTVLRPELEQLGVVTN